MDVHLRALLADPIPPLRKGDAPIGFAGALRKIEATAEDLHTIPLDRLVAQEQDLFHVKQRILKTASVSSMWYHMIASDLSDEVFSLVTPAHGRVDDPDRCKGAPDLQNASSDPTGSAGGQPSSEAGDHLVAECGGRVKEQKLVSHTP